jgi:2-polyprenyl-3-methyl-5-hydroxy-6-metoxy-1,4-benzoquinol methylase
MPDQGSEGKLSLFLRQQRFLAAMPFLKGRILDIGCGTGTLAKWFEPKNYVGVDIDSESVNKAHLAFPKHRFDEEMPNEEEKFDTVVALAVIEHVPAPTSFLLKLAQYLKCQHYSYIVCTTPHPSFEWIHEVGAEMGLFSKHACEEHEALLNKKFLAEVAASAGLRMTVYRRFLLGANQLAVFQAKVNMH